MNEGPCYSYIIVIIIIKVGRKLSERPNSVNVKVIFMKMHKECNVLFLNSSHNTGFIRYLKDTQELVHMFVT